MTDAAQKITNAIIQINAVIEADDVITQSEYDILIEEIEYAMNNLNLIVEE